jgi:hypothetical protein
LRCRGRKLLSRQLGSRLDMIKRPGKSFVQTIQPEKNACLE